MIIHFVVELTLIGYVLFLLVTAPPVYHEKAEKHSKILCVVLLAGLINACWVLTKL